MGGPSPGMMRHEEVVVVVVVVTEFCSVGPEGWKLLEPTHPSTCTPHAEDILDMSAVL